MFQAVGQDLVDNAAVLEAVNQEAFDLLQELRQGEGLVDMMGFEEQLRFVNEKWNEAKYKVQAHAYSLQFYLPPLRVYACNQLKGLSESFIALILCGNVAGLKI